MQFISIPFMSMAFMSMQFISSFFCCANTPDAGNVKARTMVARVTFFSDQLIDRMLKQPILINRPVVVTPLGTSLCRTVRGCVGHPAVAP